jgi:acetyl-CoA carboxylase biotin carboxylase subunit
VPVVPGTKGNITTDVSKEVAEIGYPVLIKASAGGGDKGMRIVRMSAALRRSLRALGELRIVGVKTTAEMHAKVVAHPVFMSGNFDTHFIENTPVRRLVE